MTTTMFAVAALTIFAAFAWQARRITALARTAPVRSRRATSPLQEAEKVLARRYARGEIGLDEYRRTLAIIRR